MKIKYRIIQTGPREFWVQYKKFLRWHKSGGGIESPLYPHPNYPYSDVEQAKAGLAKLITEHEAEGPRCRFRTVIVHTQESE